MRLPGLDPTPIRRAAALVATVGAAAVSAALLGGTSPASGSPAAVDPLLPAGGGSCSAWNAKETVCEFASVGAAQSFVVPAWQTRLGFEATGADGGRGIGPGAADGGKGAVATVDGIRFSAGERLQVRVGGRPVDGVGIGGWNGGGNGGAGAGGGATDVRRAPFATADRFLVAGGGGGGGSRQLFVDYKGDPGPGGAGGSTNGAGSVSPGEKGSHGYEMWHLAWGGAGGGASVPGAGGAGSEGAVVFGCGEESWPFSSGYPRAGDAGIGGTGGSGGSLTSTRGVVCTSLKGFGGGGGGGYLGGGGGGASLVAAGGGGGGSSVGPPGVVFTRSTSARPGLNIGVPAPAGWRNDSVRVTSGTHLASPVTASNRGNATDIFYLDATGAALHTRVLADSSMREDRVGAVFAPGSTPTSVSRSSNSIDLFGRRADNALWHTAWNGTSWGQARRVGPAGLLASSPSVTSWGPGRLDVFGRGQGGHLVHYWSDDAGTAWSYEVLGNRLLTGDPSAVSWGPNRIDVLSIDVYGNVQHMYWDGYGWTTWIPWAGPDAPVLGSDPSISSSGPGQLNIVVRDERGELLGRRFANNTWTWWKPLAAVPARPGERVGLVSWRDGSMSAYARGELENGLWINDLAWL